MGPVILHGVVTCPPGNHIVGSLKPSAINTYVKGLRKQTRISINQTVMIYNLNISTDTIL